jgi:transcriptional regulator with XRE-family HTH domain
MAEKLLKIFGRRVKELRKMHGMTQVELARKVGAKGNNTVSNWENGENGCELEVIEKLADIFGVDPSYLLSDKKLNGHVDEFDKSMLLTHYVEMRLLRNIDKTHRKLIGTLYQQIDIMEKELTRLRS